MSFYLFLVTVYLIFHGADFWAIPCLYYFHDLIIFIFSMSHDASSFVSVMHHRLRQRLFAETNTFYTVLKLFKDEPKMHQESFLSLFEFKRVERLYCAIVAFPWTLAPSAGKTTCLLAIVSNRWQDGAKGLESHGDVQQMSSKEEVVEVSKNRHGGVPNEIQERLEEEKVNIFLWGSFWTSHWW